MEIEPPIADRLSSRSFSGYVWLVASIAVVASAYLATLAPGHPLRADDFAAYVKHASNLAEGRPYAALDFIPNPNAMWITPAGGYPPVFPLLLLPVYKAFGMNLWAMKFVPTIAFIIFLSIFLRFIAHRLPLYGCVFMVFLIGFNPLFWEYRNYILSEFPYLMFSFAALLMIDVSYRNLEPAQRRLLYAFFTALLLYCAYGTRSVGIALVPALILTDLFKFKRPSRFLFTVLVLTAIPIALQSFLANASKAYANLTDFSPASVFRQFVFYGKSSSYIWANGHSKGAQIVFALIFTTLAALGFLRDLWNRRSAAEFYVIAYLGILLVYSPQNGLRVLMPVLPLYFLYALEEFTAIIRRFSRLGERTLAVSFALAIALTYVGDFTWASRLPSPPNVQDASFRQLCSFVKSNTESTDVIAFGAPRSLILFTDRSSTVLGPGDSLAETNLFLRQIHATIIVQANWEPTLGQSFIETNAAQLTEIFHNSTYSVFRINGYHGSYR